MMTLSPNPPERHPTVLIIGATGGLGRQLAVRLCELGWPVRALTRHAGMAQTVRSGRKADAGLQNVQWCLGDAMHAADVAAAAQGVDFIVHAANPPRYQHWRALALPMLRNAVEAARSSGARLILPGNLYNFGPDAGALVNESSPQNPLTRKGAVRVEMERMLADAAAHAHAPVRSIVLRAGDFFGGHAPSSWFQTLLVKPGRELKQVVYPGEPDVGHAWAYLPDLAEAMVQLMRLDASQATRMAPCEVLHFAGHWLPQGIDMAHAVCRAAPHRALAIKRFPWLLVRILSPVVPVLREMLEMRYLWQVPLRLDASRLAQLIGPEPHTPLDEAVRASLQSLGCLTEAGSR